MGEIVMLKVHAKNLGTVAVLCLQGQIVNGETEILRNAVHSLSEVSAVILDLARVTTVDAGGLGVMLELREQVQSKGIRFELMNVTKWVAGCWKSRALILFSKLPLELNSFRQSRVAGKRR
jgi:anti-anti-sigma factor